MSEEIVIAADDPIRIAYKAISDTLQELHDAKIIGELNDVQWMEAFMTLQKLYLKRKCPM